MDRKPEPKVETDNSQKFADFIQEIDCMMIVQGADEYVISRSECVKANTDDTKNTKNTPKDIEKTISEKVFADRERKIVNQKERGYAPGSLFRISHGKYLRDVYQRQM